VTILGIVLAGCVGSQGQADAARGPQAPKAATDDPSANVRGLVVDDSQKPIADADVALLDIDKVTKTDATGAFAFASVAAGPHKLATQKLGYESVARNIEVGADGVQLQIVMVPVAVAQDVYAQLLIGQGYLACGAYLTVVTISNLNVCPWDTNHKPRYEFPVDKATSKGVLQEITWSNSQALSTDTYYVYLWYKPICNPTCNPTKKISEMSGKNPVRQYSDISKFKADEDPFILSSMTFVGPDQGKPVALVYQQKITHYVTVFHNGQGDPDKYTAVPDH
jgi:hypothetical protein